MPPASVFERVVGWLAAHPLRVDALLAALVLLPSLATAFADRATLLVSLALVVPLAWRRSRPVLTGVAITGAGLAQLALVPNPLVADVAVLLAVYALAAYAPTWASATALALGVVGAGLASLAYVAYAGLFSVVVATGTIALAVLVAWALGSTQRVRLKYAAQLAERARLLEVEREQESLLAATAERQRIAREMHDVVAHSLSVIVAQADGGRYAAAADPATAAGALQTVSDTGRQALADMRSLLGVLREDPSAATVPQPDADRVPELVEGVRASGLPVDLEVQGRPRPLPPAVGLAAYRVVQESLTNVLKHAGPAASARVALAWGERALEVSVVDDGRGAGAPAGGGHGVEGMGERVRLHGGDLVAGPRPGGGFEVRARLPYGRGA